MHGPIPVFGLVGGMGAGKSTVAARLEELGAHVIDADAVGHALLNQRPVRDQVVQRFGPSILEAVPPDGNLPAIDRRALGAIVFQDKQARRALEAILHPAMRKTFEKAIARIMRRGKPRAVVLDAAVLYEAGWDDLCDKVIFIDAPREQRLERLRESRGWDDATLAAREISQWPLEDKQSRASLVIPNDRDPSALRSAIGGQWNALIKAPRHPRRGAVAGLEQAAEEANSSTALETKFDASTTAPSPSNTPTHPNHGREPGQ